MLIINRLHIISLTYKGLYVPETVVKLAQGCLRSRLAGAANAAPCGPGLLLWPHWSHRRGRPSSWCFIFEAVSHIVLLLDGGRGWGGGGWTSSRLQAVYPLLTAPHDDLPWQENRTIFIISVVGP